MKTVWEGRNIRLVYAVDELPRHKNYPFNWRRSARYYDIKDRKIRKCYLHQKGGGYVPGFEGVLRTAMFIINDPKYDENGKWKGTGRGWPFYPYTIDFPHKPNINDGKAIVYQTNNWDTVSWHSGDNVDSISIAWQGYLRSRHLWKFRPFKGTDGKPSQRQVDGTLELWEDFIRPKWGLTDVGLVGHYLSPRPKKSCPGDDGQRFIERAGTARRRGATEILVGHEMPGDYILDSWEQRQAAIVAIGFDIGTYGPNGNGVDGCPGEDTRLAIEALERSAGLPANGIWDNEVEAYLRNFLIMLNISQDQIDALI